MTRIIVEIVLAKEPIGILAVNYVMVILCYVYIYICIYIYGVTEMVLEIILSKSSMRICVVTYVGAIIWLLSNVTGIIATIVLT